MIDLFGILINQDFFISLVDVNKENDISVLAGVSYPTPRAPGIPFPFPFKGLPRRLIDTVQNTADSKY